MANTVIAWHKGFETKDIVGGSIETTNYFFANKELVAMKKPGNLMRYYHSDHLGSTTVITDQSGDLVEETSFGPWGELMEGGSESKYQFTGQEKDTETGLNYMNARYYSSELKRFTQPDELLPDVYDPQMLNRYAYARNNPLKYTDPSGNDIVLHGGRIQSTNTVLNNPQPKPQQTTQQYVNSITNPLGNRSTSVANPSNNASRVTNTPSNSGGSSSDCRCSRPNNPTPVTDIYNAVIGDSINTLKDPRANTFDKGVVGVEFLPLGRVVKAIKGASLLTKLGNHKLLTKEEVRRIEKALGEDIHTIKGPNSSKYDLYKDDKGNVIQKPKGGKGEGTEIDINLRDID